jgi:hypothetical protein
MKAGISQANLAMGTSGALSQGTSAHFNATVTEEGTATGANLKWGYSPSALIHTEALTESSNVWSKTNIPAAAGATVYGRFQLTGTGGAEVGNTGIYVIGPLT